MREILTNRLFNPLLVLGMLSTILLSCTQGADPSVATVKLRDRQFNIPKQFFINAQALSWFRNIPGLDSDGHSLLLKIDEDYLAKHILGYVASNGKYRENIILYFSVMDEKSRKAALDPKRMQDLWYATGLYKSRIIEKEGSDFRVFIDFEYPRRWELLRVYPDPSKPLPETYFDYSLGICEQTSSPVAETQSFYECKIQMLASSNLFFDFNVSEQNMHLLSEIKRFLAELVESWEAGPGKSEIK